MEVNFSLDNFSESKNPITISPNCVGYTCRLQLEDPKNRKLNLSVMITPNVDSKLKVNKSFCKFYCCVYNHYYTQSKHFVCLFKL